MIEPQNTTMPLAADPAPVEIPQGEAGFGEMLAQTLGMIPQLDPNAIQRIAGQSSEGEEDSADLMAGARDDSADGLLPTLLTRDIPGKGRGQLTVAKATPVKQPPVNDGSFVNPVYDKGQPPGPAQVPDAPVAGLDPDLAPQPPVATHVPIEDGIGDPVLAAQQPEVAGDSLPTTPRPLADPMATAPVVSPLADPDPAAAVDPIVVEPDPQPEPPPSAPISPPISAPIVSPADPDPIATPATPTPVDSTPIAPTPVTATPTRSAPAAEPLQPVVAEPAPTAPVSDRGLPTEPTPSAVRPTTAPAQHGAPVEAPATTAAPSTGREAVDAVRISDAGVQMPSDNTVSLGERAVRVEGSRPAVAGPAPQSFAVESAPQQPASPVPATAPAAPVQHSALAARVMQAVELQANQPPPRTMVVDIPEIEGLRLVVSVRGGAEVHVVPASASTATDGVQPFLDELQGVLESRGFVMTGDGRRRNGQPEEQDESAPPRPARPSFRRPEPTDNDLRI